MKKVISLILFALLTVTALCITSVAKDSFVKENEFTIVSYNGTEAFVGKDDRFSELEDSIYWLTDNKDTFNIKYVSFIGNIGQKCEDTYAQIVYYGKKTTSELIAISLKNEKWHEQYRKLYDIVKPIVEAEIPMGISVSNNDYVSGGYSRDTLVPQYLGLESIMPDEAV